MDSYLLKFILELSIFRVNCIYVFLETSQYVHARHLVNTVSAEFCIKKKKKGKKSGGNRKCLTTRAASSARDLRRDHERSVWRWKKWKPSQV